MSDMSFLHQHDDIDGILSPSKNNVLIGHKNARHFLTKIRQEKRLYHALLFEGRQGIGKATLAFHFAWNLLSSKENEFLQPSYDSTVWRQIGQGCHPNLLHISRQFDLKAKKIKVGISIDDIRNIAHFLNQKVSNNAWRIIIVDPADDMNKNAANAILKILEEPPAKTVFIIIAHSSGKLLSTIRSRCQQIFLQPLHDNEMKEVVLQFLPEKMRNDKEFIEMIIQKSQGSPRKAALLVCGGFEISETIHSILENPVLNLARAHDFAQVLLPSNSDIQFQQFCEEILHKIQRETITSAENKNFILSKKYAQIWQDTHQKITALQTFNLDKKQFIINLLCNLHKIIHKHRLFS
ncbi:DNA polymerase III subunit delta' [Bartonella ancashensis]|uniref:DNA polymerase III delta prime subunit n=1 Tax=Bartonella ancashensis TaxID=1318743 RepID=A0A0M4M6F5_9HYPH|nr:DNA polymerase III subunit delta' [Bartonella ancashensis]ALE03779.1 DNA polymerase III delta prime subunit [Bartonella ancashensis]